MSLLGISNKYFLQIFFIRLTKVEYWEVREMKLYECSVLPDGNAGIGFNRLKGNKIRFWAIMYWVVPFTGWNTDFRFLGKGRKLWRITKKNAL